MTKRTLLVVPAVGLLALGVLVPLSLGDVPEPTVLAARAAAAANARASANQVVLAATTAVDASPPERVQVLADAAIDPVGETRPTFVVRVADEDGRPVLGAKAVLSVSVAHGVMNVTDGDPELASRITHGSGGTTAPFDGASVALLRDCPIAFAVQAPGHVTVARAFVAAPPPERVDIVLRRTGGVHGVVRGGGSAAYDRSVSIWRVEDDAKLRAAAKSSRWDRFYAHSCPVGAKGTFVAQDLAPGEYRAAVAREGRARTGDRADEQVDAVPLVDGAEDLRSVVAFSVSGGADTFVEIAEPRLGALRGRVLLGGRPFAGATVVATRPGWRPLSETPPDWDNTLHLGWASCRLSAADGAVTFAYRDAGIVELRVRHPDGAATSAPILVDLPPPGADVLCDVPLPAGGIRGRFPIETIAEDQRKSVDAVLYPMHKAGLDPYAYAGVCGARVVAYGCAQCDLDPSGAFAFESLPAGDWLVRICTPGFGWHGPSLGTAVHWQRVITVHGEAVDLGELSLPRTATVAFTWQWQGPAPEHVASVELHQAHEADAAAVWVQSFAADGGRGASNVPPGHYLLSPLTHSGRAGGVAVRVAPDGTVTPPVVTFALPAKPR